MIILGINAYHGDSAACVVRDGRLVAAAEEERFRRIKHWAGFPLHSIRYCLREAGVALSDVDHAAINQDSKANLGRKIAYAIRRRPDAALMRARLRTQRMRATFERALSASFPGDAFKGCIHHVEHHLAHLASAFFVCPYEEAVAVSVDGFGDFASAAWGLGKGSTLRVEDRVFFPHSLGMFYEAVTRHLGFPRYGDEYKVMGLAAYGKPTLMERMRELVRLRSDGKFELNLRFFRHHRERIDYQWLDCEPQTANVASDALAELLGPPRLPDDPITDHHRDLARSAQAMYEEAFFHLLCRLHERYQADRLTLAGGCAMNSVANGKIHRSTPFREVYVQSAAGDAGGAIGAALAAWHAADAARGSRANGGFVMDHAYWGPGFGDDEIREAVEARRAQLGDCDVARIADESELCRSTAQAIARGEVVGWFQGRMEWGPRALGNRSILCDPRRADMKELLNRKIKRRESFRPFAPSILRECTPEWFEADGDVPFMMQVYPIRREKSALIPAVTHVDGSGRLQTVTREANPLYYALIEAFRALTGVPMVLNTSFNENEPVVCRPQEALECFLRTRMDRLVMGAWTIRRAA